MSSSSSPEKIKIPPENQFSLQVNLEGGKSIRDYLERVDDLKGVHTTISSYPIWKAADETNNAGKMIPVSSHSNNPSTVDSTASSSSGGITYGKRDGGKGVDPILTFFFDDNMKLSQSKAENAHGCVNLRDVDTGEYIDFRKFGPVTPFGVIYSATADSANESSGDDNPPGLLACCGDSADSRAAKRRRIEKREFFSAVRASKDGGTIIVQTCILDAILDPDFFTRIVQFYSHEFRRKHRLPANKRLRIRAFVDVNKTVMLADSATGKDCADVLHESVLDITTVMKNQNAKDADPSLDQFNGKTVYYALKYMLGRKTSASTLQGLDFVLTNLKIDPAQWEARDTEPPVRLFYGATEVTSRDQLDQIVQMYLQEHTTGWEWSLESSPVAEPAKNRSMKKSGTASPENRAERILVVAWQRFYDQYAKENLLMLYTFGVDAPKVYAETSGISEQPQPPQTFLSTDAQNHANDRSRFAHVYVVE